MNEEQPIVPSPGIPPPVPVPMPPVSTPPVTPPPANSFEVISNVPTTPQAPINKNVIYVVAVLGIFILLLGFAFLLFPKNKNEKQPYTNDVYSAPVVRPTPSPSYQPETVQGVPTPTPQAYVPPPPRQIAPKQNGVFGVPLISATVSYDLTFDGVITNDDVRIVAQTIDQGRYSALVDFDSNGRVDVADLGMMRSVMLEYPVVCYDLTMDQLINKDDISIVAQLIDQGQYSALVDFDANGMVDVGDLALIRNGVTEAGAVSTISY